jgi:hypothetical protein
VVAVSGDASYRPEATPGVFVDRLVVGVDGVALVLRQAVPLVRPRERGGALMDQEHVLIASSFADRRV